MALFYNRVLDKLRKFDQPIGDPKTLRLIPYVGEKTVQSLTKQLRQHCETTGIEFPKQFEEKQREAVTTDQPPLKKRKRKEYIPKHRSGGFAILIALYLGDKQRVGLSREEIIKRASPYSDKSFSTGTNDFYSAWSLIKVLVSNEVVDFSGRSPKVYYLTDEGMELAKKLVGTLEDGETEGKDIDISYDNHVMVSEDEEEKEQEGDGMPDSPILSQNVLSQGVLSQNVLSQSVLSQSGASQSAFQSAASAASDRLYNSTHYDVWPENEYEIILIIDTREIKSLLERDFFNKRLSALNVACDTRALTVGDVLWIARHITTGKEVVLDYICERKKFSDLVLSIKDGRFQEQKNRLKKTGMSHLYYVVEESGIESGDNMESVKTALAMTMTASHFYLKKFRDIDESILFLASITEVIKESLSKTRLIVLKPRTLDSQSDYTNLLLQFKLKFENRSTKYKCVHKFSVFQELMAKTEMMTVKEAFILMLMAIRGVSLERAITIQSRFKTPSQMIKFYNVGNRELGVEGKKLLMMNEFKDQVGNKKIGKVVLESIYKVWGQ